MLHALPLSAAADGVFTLIERTEARARYPDPTTNALALDLDELVDARAVWKEHQATYTLADLPRFTLLDYNGAAIQAAVSDGLLASAEWRWPRTQLRAAESASYGAQSFESGSALPAVGTPEPSGTSTGQQPPPSVGVVAPTSQLLPYVSSYTSVGSTQLLRRWTFVTSLGYQLSGGADGAAQKNIPFQQGPLAAASADYRLGRRDHLLTLASGSESSFSGGAEDVEEGTEDVLVEAEEQWRHRWTRTTDTLLAAGWYAIRSRVGSTAPNTFTSSPDAEAGINERFIRGGSRWEFRADAHLAPLINPLTGLVDEQIRATLEGSWGHRPFTLRALASAGGSTDQGTSVSSRLATAEIDLAYWANAVVTLDGGLRFFYQEQNLYQDENGVGPTPGAPNVQSTLVQGVLFFAVTVHAVKARL